MKHFETLGIGVYIIIKINIGNFNFTTKEIKYSNVYQKEKYKASHDHVFMK